MSSEEPNIIQLITWYHVLFLLQNIRKVIGQSSKYIWLHHLPACSWTEELAAQLVPCHSKTKRKALCLLYVATIVITLNIQPQSNTDDRAKMATIGIIFKIQPHSHTGNTIQSYSFFTIIIQPQSHTGKTATFPLCVATTVLIINKEPESNTGNIVIFLLCVATIVITLNIKSHSNTGYRVIFHLYYWVQPESYTGKTGLCLLCVATIVITLNKEPHSNTCNMVIFFLFTTTIVNTINIQPYTGKRVILLLRVAIVVITLTIFNIVKIWLPSNTENRVLF